MAYNNNNFSKFIQCLRKPIECRTNEDTEILYLHLRGMQAMAGLPESAVRVMCQTARYQVHDSNYLLYIDNDQAHCWYILLNGSVFLDGRMYLPGSSFGKQPLGHHGRRGTDCLVLEHSEMIVIDYPDSNLLHPYQRHSYTTNELEKLLALETEDYVIGGPMPEDEKLPMELQHVKEILMRSELAIQQAPDCDQRDTNHAPNHARTNQLQPTDNHLELDLTGLVESIVDSDDDEAESHSSQESLMVRDVVRDCLEKDPAERTESDIQTLLDFMQNLPAFANMTLNVRKALCAVMVFAVVEKGNSVVMDDGEELDSWSVILNGSVEVSTGSEEPCTLHLGDSFGVEPTLKKMYHKGVMKTRVDDCQFVCVAQGDYHRILSQGEINTQCVEEEGQVVMVTEHRTTDGGNRQGHVVIKANPERLVGHLVEDHSVIDPTYVEDFLLTYKTFLDKPREICGQLLNWFSESALRDKVTRVMLLWANNHYHDFEGDHMMEDYLEAFENGLEQQTCAFEAKPSKSLSQPSLGEVSFDTWQLEACSEKMSGQLGLLNIACAAKAKCRTVTVERPSLDQPLGITIAGGKETGYGVFVSKVDRNSRGADAGLRRGDQIIEVNGQSFENTPYSKAKDILSRSTRVTMTVRRNMTGYKEMITTPPSKDGKSQSQNKDVHRSSSDCTDRHRQVQTLNNRLSTPEIYTSGANKRHPLPSPAPTATERMKKAFNKISTLGTLSKSTRIISRSEKDIASLDSGLHEPGSDESHAVAKLSTKVKTRGSIPFGSTESIESSHSGEQMIEIPDKVVRLYRADQTFKYFPIFQDTTARELVNMAVDAFGIAEPPLNYSLCQVTVGEGGFIKQKRLSDALCNVADIIPLNGRYYMKNNAVSSPLLPEENAQDLAKESQISLLQLKSQEVARELTLQDFEVFRTIDPREYIYDLWKFSPEFKENLTKFSELVNTEMFWVVTEICGEANLVKRMKILKHFIKIARHCKDCKNFNSMFAIVSGLGHSAVQRLRNTWDKLPTKYCKVFDELQNLMDPSRNMSKYRNLLNSKQAHPPVIPFFPVITKDLTFIHLGNDSMVDGLINFEKLRMIAREVRQISKLGSVPYDPSTMFDPAPSSAGVTSTVVGVVTGSSAWNRKSGSLGSNNPKRMYEEAMMTRKVQEYLKNLNVVSDEDELREMSQACEASQGSAPPSAQVRRRNSPTTSPSNFKKDRKHANKIATTSPLAFRRSATGERASISSTTSSSSLPEPSPNPGAEAPSDDVFHPEKRPSLEQRIPIHIEEANNQRPLRPHSDPLAGRVRRPLNYSDYTDHPTDSLTPYGSANSTTSSQDSALHTGNQYPYGSYTYREPYRVEYIDEFDDDQEGQVSAV